MAEIRIKQELLADRSSPTIPNTSSRAQTISSAAGSPAYMPTQTTDDSDATMSGLGEADPLLIRDVMEYLGAESRRSIQTIKKLEELDINTTLQLPKFVVVGDQSAGKSSIVEALCDISLPRSSGTCTRCPFLITTSSQGHSNVAAWACSISIQSGFYLDVKGPNDDGCFKPRAGPNVVTHFATVTEKSELESMLRRAQLAILNPRDDPQVFVGIDLASNIPKSQVPFSPNIVSLEIQGPNLPELYFYDLPGSINVIEDDEDQQLVRWIEQLVTSYIKDEKCLILLACGADQDVETSTTFRFIKDCQATKRCAGVLTKADLLPPGKLAYVKQILTGKKFTLGKGWYLTKQLSQAQIDQGISHAMARDLESTFFGQQPWADLVNLHDHFGIRRLEKSVSHWMAEHIRGELPEIINRIEARFDDVSHDLSLLPESPLHPQLDVANDIYKLESTIASHVKGERDVNLFREKWEKVTSTFRKHLSEMKPSVSFKTPGYQAPSISLDTDDDSEPATPTPARVAIRSSTSVRPSVTPSSSRKRTVEEATPQRRTKADPATPSVPTRQSFTLDTLKSQYARGSTSGVPGSVNAKVTDRIILESLSSWDVAVSRLLEDANGLIKSLIIQSIDNVLKTKNLHLTEFYSRTKDELSAFVARMMHDESDRLRRLLSCEQEKPIVTHSNWTSLRNATLRGLQAQRNLQRVNEHFDTIEATPKAKITPIEKRAEKANDAAWMLQTLGMDDYTTEIDSLATIMCYYENAVMCFVNTAVKSLEFGVLRPLRNDIAQVLRDGLNAGDPAVCAQLLAEDADRERQRVALLGEKAKLEKAMAEIGELQN